MKKRLISMALAVSMAVSIMPAPALATVGRNGRHFERYSYIGFRFDGADSCCYKRRKCPIERRYYVNRHSLYQ